LPAARSFTGPFPPGAFAARLLAAVILPPLLFFDIFNTSSNYRYPVDSDFYLSAPSMLKKKP